MIIPSGAQARTFQFEDGETLLFNKPLHWTSFDLVNKVRNIIRHALKIKKIKVGHAGTLDPLATGLLIVCTGRHTKNIDAIQTTEKEYIATLRFGQTTPSFDLETLPDAEYPVEHITEEILRACLQGFLGPQMQTPPLHSAVKVEGKRAYELARAGKEKVLDAKPIEISELELTGFELPFCQLRMRCTKGTYVRAFARDIGLALGSGAHLVGLERTAVGAYHLPDAFAVEEFEALVQQNVTY